MDAAVGAGNGPGVVWCLGSSSICPRRYGLHRREGLELSDGAAACAVAIESIRDMLSDQEKAGRLNLRHRIEVEDEQRRPVTTLPFSVEA